MPNQLKNKPRKRLKKTVQRRRQTTSLVERSGRSSSIACVNAYWEGREVVAVCRDGDRLYPKRFKAESVCYLRRTDVSLEFERVLRKRNAVVSVQPSGDWLRVGFRDYTTLKNACVEGGFFERQGVVPFEADVNPVRRWLTETDVEIQKPRRCYIDIETDSRRTFKEASEGKTRVLCWALTDDDGDTVYGCLEEDTDAAEKVLIEDLWCELNRYDQVCAWSGNAWSQRARASDVFDFKVIWLRTVKHTIAVNIKRWLWLSHLKLFQRYNMSASESGDEKQSVSLDAVSKALGLGGKYDFDASKAWEYWEAGGDKRRELIEYNIDDAEQMMRIEAETHYIDLHYTTSSMCNTFPDSRGIDPTNYFEGYVMKLGHQHGVRFATRFGYKPSEPYEGAYVFKPKQGLLRDVHVFDFSGLYPSIVMSWNMSPETHLGERARIRSSSKMNQPFVMDAGETIDLQPDVEIPDGCSVAPFTLQLFKTDVQGMLPYAFERLVEFRNEIKRKLAKVDASSDEWANLSRLSKACKIVINSGYGVCGSPFSRFFVRDLAESITQAGKWLLLCTKAAGMERGIEFVSGDTDSGFVVGVDDDGVKEFVAECNAGLYPGLLESVGAPKNYISLGYEEKFSVLISDKKKRYAGRLSLYDGKPVEGYKLIVKGLEYKRGDRSRLTREMQKEFLDMTLGDGCFELETALEFVRRWKKKILEEPIPFKDVLIAKQVKKPLGAYVRKPLKGGGLSAYPAHVEVARILAERGKPIREGVRVEYVVVDGKSSPMKVIPADDFDGELDRFYLWENQVFPATMCLLEVVHPQYEWKKLELKVRPRKSRAKKKKASSKSDAAEKEDQAKAQTETQARPPRKKLRPKLRRKPEPKLRRKPEPARRSEQAADRRG